ncbi:MAG: hypothetical protein PHR83_08015 [Paludibacter sp.]|nr:hypothetical protein [Paludibacter sp.]
MIRVEDNKLIIEIELGEAGNNIEQKAAGKVDEIQSALIEAIQYYDYKTYGEPQFQFVLLQLMKETFPTFEQQKAILKSI